MSLSPSSAGSSSRFSRIQRKALDFASLNKIEYFEKTSTLKLQHSDT
eukprot:gene1148-841_t